MSNGTDIPAAAAPARPRLPRDNLAWSDRVFLAIENPVLRRELLAALRSQKAFVLHFFFLLVLGAVIYRAWPLETTSTRAELAHKLFRIFGESMLVLLSILSPAFSASAMTVEKERRCLDLLLASPVKPSTILIGKYMSSVLYLLLLVLSTAPLVSVILWLGGVGPKEIAGLYILLAAVAAAFGMTGLSCSVFFQRSQTSLAMTYMIILPLAALLLVCAVNFDGFFVLASAAWPAGILLFCAVVLYRACHRRLQQPFDSVFRAGEEEDVAAQTGLVLVRDRFPDNLLAAARGSGPMPDGGNPVYEKEIRSEVVGRGTLFLRLIIQISMFLSVVALTFLFIGRQLEFVFVDFLIVFSMLVAPAFGCVTFTQERERGTLDLLLTSMLRPGQIVFGKFLSCLRLTFFLTGLVGIMLLFYILIQQGQESFLGRCLYLLVYVTIIAATIVLETAVGMFFSLVLRGGTQSIITTYSVLLVLFGAPVAASQLISTFTKLQAKDISGVLFLSPFEAVYSVVQKTGGEAAAFAGSVSVWQWYLAFCVGVSAMLMGYILASFERWNGARSKIQ